MEVLNNQIQGHMIIKVERERGKGGRFLFNMGGILLLFYQDPEEAGNPKLWDEKIIVLKE